MKLLKKYVLGMKMNCLRDKVLLWKCKCWQWGVRRFILLDGETLTFIHSEPEPGRGRQIRLNNTKHYQNITLASNYGKF